MYVNLPNTLLNPSTPSALYYVQEDPYLKSLERFVKIDMPKIKTISIISQEIKNDGLIIDDFFQEKEDGNVFLLYTLKDTPKDFNAIKYSIDLMNKLDDMIPNNVFVNIL